MKTNLEKTIPDFPGYTITEDGKVFSTRSGAKVELKQRIAQNGYISVTATRADGSRTSEGIHYLKALAFKNDTRHTGENEVNHIDGNKLNNNLDNLEWCTHSHNEQHKVKNFMTKRTKPVVICDFINKTTKIAPSTREADRMLHSSVNTVSKALARSNAEIVDDCMIWFKED